MNRWRVTLNTSSGPRAFYVYALNKEGAADTFVRGWRVLASDVVEVKRDRGEWKTLLYEGAY